MKVLCRYNVVLLLHFCRVCGWVGGGGMDNVYLSATSLTHYLCSAPHVPNSSLVFHAHAIQTAKR